MQSLIKIFLLNTAVVFLFNACKKNNDDLMAPLQPANPATTNNNTNTDVPTGDLLKDSSAAIARDIYLWNNQIPASFNARNYEDYSGIMTAIRVFSNETGFGQPVDKWSFAMKKTEWDQMSGGMGSTFSSASADGDLGIQVFFKSEGDLRVRLVEPNSPAGRAGIRRSWRIRAINGNSNMSTSNSSFIIDNVYNASSSSVTLERPDGSQVTLSLTASTYPEKPVYLDTVYTQGNERIGYLVFNSFLGNTSQIQSEFSRVFSKFASRNITALVVDLRYNGGGYVSLQEKLANYIVNNSANGQLMMKQIYNEQNSNNNTTTLFHKAGSVNLNDVYFIVGRGTASASELLINNLSPYMDVKLIGASNTHGKPVGYFPIPIGDWYIFPVSFKTVNRNNEGNYYNGLSVNAQVADGLDKDWGDLNETSLASALRHITTGGFFREAPYYEPLPVAEGNQLLEQEMLKITVDTRSR